MTQAEDIPLIRYHVMDEVEESARLKAVTKHIHSDFSINTRRTHPSTAESGRLLVAVQSQWVLLRLFGYRPDDEGVATAGKWTNIARTDSGRTSAARW